MASESEDPSSASQATQSSGDDGSTGVAPPRACAVPPDEDGGLTTITLRNRAPFPILMGRDAGCEFEPFDLEGPGGDLIAWHRSSCANTCEEVAKGECSFCGSCGGSTFLRLESGAEYTVEWTQSRVQSEPIPADCEDACELSCGRVTPVDAGDYTFTSFVRTCDDEACVCPDGETACLVFPEDAELSEPVSLTMTAAVPTDTLEILFE